MAPVKAGSIAVLDFGGQYAHLLARRVRECGAYSEIRDAAVSAQELRAAAGVILSGGPQSVYDPRSPQGDREILALGVPILGICYGHQWLAHVLGGAVLPGETREYGRTDVEVLSEGALFSGLPREFRVWMSHGDAVTELPQGFHCLARSAGCAHAAMEDGRRRIFGVQFHPEVIHTEHGLGLLRRFVRLCDAAPWSIESCAKRLGDQIRQESGGRKVFMLVSGGVDSTVAFTLLNAALGADHVQGLFIDTGLMRKGEVREIARAFDRLGIRNLRIEDASGEFFQALGGVADPEEKRRVIGETFLAVQQRVLAMHNLSPAAWLLGQGTIYPDTVETGGTAHADHIKTHHNRIPAIQAMVAAGRVIEPLKELYKDEVRRLGEELGLPHALVWRHPFPGPGLGVRILCAKEEVWPEGWRENAEKILGSILAAIGTLSAPYRVRVLPVRSVGVQGDARTYRHAAAVFTQASIPPDVAAAVPNHVPAINRVLLCASHREPPPLSFTQGCVTRDRAGILRAADAIVSEEMHKAGLYGAIWQFPVVLLPVGVRSGGQSIVLRPVTSVEAMTAEAFRLPSSFLQEVTGRLMVLPGIDMVFCDLTSKPPATIEWE